VQGAVGDHNQRIGAAYSQPVEQFVGKDCLAKCGHTLERRLIDARLPPPRAWLCNSTVGGVYSLRPESLVSSRLWNQQCFALLDEDPVPLNETRTPGCGQFIIDPLGVEEFLTFFSFSFLMHPLEASQGLHTMSCALMPGYGYNAVDPVRERYVDPEAKRAGVTRTAPDGDHMAGIVSEDPDQSDLFFPEQGLEIVQANGSSCISKKSAAGRVAAAEFRHDVLVFLSQLIESVGQRLFLGNCAGVSGIDITAGIRFCVAQIHAVPETADFRPELPFLFEQFCSGLIKFSGCGRTGLLQVDTAGSQVIQ